MKHDISSFGKRIKSRREELGITQKELARRIWSIEISGQGDRDEKGIARALETYRKRLCSYENSGVFPDNPDIYSRLCESLDCSMDYLFGGTVYDDNGKEQVACLPNPFEETLKKQLHLSSLASTYMRIAIDSYTNEKINEVSVNLPEFHNFEIGKKGKFLFLQHLLENPEIWEIIGAAFFDHILELEYAKVAPHDSTLGFSHLDLAEIHISKAQSALKELFTIVPSQAYDELGILPQKK